MDRFYACTYLITQLVGQYMIGGLCSESQSWTSLFETIEYGWSEALSGRLQLGASYLSVFEAEDLEEEQTPGNI